jgi:hypothetical protein
LYNINDDLRLQDNLEALGDRLSCNFVDCLSGRELGINSVSGGRFFSDRLSSEYG